MHHIKWNEISEVYNPIQSTALQHWLLRKSFLRLTFDSAKCDILLYIMTNLGNVIEMILFWRGHMPVYMAAILVKNCGPSHSTLILAFRSHEIIRNLLLLYCFLFPASLSYHVQYILKNGKTKKERQKMRGRNEPFIFYAINQVAL